MWKAIARGAVALLALTLVSSPRPSAGAVTVVSNGALAFVDNTGPGRGISTINPDGTGYKRLTSSLGDVESPSWSADGSKILLQQGNVPNLIATNADGSNGQLLTNVAATSQDPDWGPTGLIVFTSDRAGTIDLYVMNADGSGMNAGPKRSHP
jgi:Tol biopolymer transport system component